MLLVKASASSAYGGSALVCSVFGYATPSLLLRDQCGVFVGIWLGLCSWGFVFGLPLAATVMLRVMLGQLSVAGDAALNRVVLDEAAWHAVTPTTLRFHRSLSIVDLHADSMLWTERNLRSRDAGIGHVDIPRLLDGGVAVQTFSIVTKAPFGLNNEGNSNKTQDMITFLTMAQRWPAATWTSLMERALFQARARCACCPLRWLC